MSGVFVLSSVLAAVFQNPTRNIGDHVLSDMLFLGKLLGGLADFSADGRYKGVIQALIQSEVYICLGLQQFPISGKVK